jgi:mRNA interferase RelE/StbE
MKWKVEIDKIALKSLSKIDISAQRRIESFLLKLALQDNPRLQGKALTGRHSGQWRYRVGDYRLICNIQDDKVVILVLELGHRKEVYKK